MGHKISLSGVLITHRKVELPDRCPHCNAEFKLGETCIEGKYLRVTAEKLRLAQVLDGKTKTDIVEVKKVVPGGGFPSVCFELRCVRCQEVVVPADVRHRRGKGTPSKGYQGDCSACNIEAEIGTEEVPHPIDGRLHTCKPLVG